MTTDYNNRYYMCVCVCVCVICIYNLYTYKLFSLLQLLSLKEDRERSLYCPLQNRMGINFHSGLIVSSSCGPWRRTTASDSRRSSQARCRRAVCGRRLLWKNRNTMFFCFIKRRMKECYISVLSKEDDNLPLVFHRPNVGC